MIYTDEQRLKLIRETLKKLCAYIDDECITADDIK